MFFCCQLTKAQKFTSPRKPSLIGVHFALVDYNSPDRIDSSSLKDVIKQGDIFNPTKQHSAVSISYWKSINKFLDISAKINSIFFDFPSNSTVNHINNKFGVEVEGSINARPIGDDHLFSPFVTTGISAGTYRGKPGAYIPLGVGFQFNIHSRVYFLLQTQFRSSLSQDIFRNNLFHSVGVAFNITRQKSERPIQIPTIKVNDRDGDGIIDSLDACPNQPGLAILFGCPDRDGDDIADKDDKCPDVAGLLKYQGCPIPDTDKDGINDEEDKCPTIPGVVQYQGCPAPDEDGDGVNDDDDKCPFEAGSPSNFGCPMIDSGVIAKINRAAQNIFFATGSAKLLPKSFASLIEVAQIMHDNPTYKIDVDGHTDNTGNKELNQQLSENRANSVKEYLIENGVDQNRIIATGYGEEKPIDDNNFPDGRAKNRRVEMRLRN